GDGFHPLGRRGKGCERAGASGVRAECCTDAGDCTCIDETGEPVDYLRLVHSESGADHCEGPRLERKVPLPLVEQAQIQGVASWHHQSPIRCARAVKKIPDGLSAAISPSFSKLRVS